jgi:Aromatic-ring-opening dioxygenase LigAB, LigA subunit
VSRYALNSLLFRLKKEPELRARLATDPALALADFDLTDAERAAVIAGDVQALNDLGGYLHLLMSIPGLESRGASAGDHGRARQDHQHRS